MGLSLQISGQKVGHFRFNIEGGHQANVFATDTAFGNEGFSERRTGIEAYPCHGDHSGGIHAPQSLAGRL